MVVIHSSTTAWPMMSTIETSRVEDDVLPLQISQPIGQEMQHEKEIGDDENGVDRQLDEHGPQRVGRFLLSFESSCRRHTHSSLVRCNAVAPKCRSSANILARTTFLPNLARQFPEGTWPTQQTNIPRT